MSLLQKAKLKLAKILKIDFASTTTDQGILEHDGDNITEGTDVFIKDEQGELIPAPDGSYHNPEDNYTYVVEDGVVVETIPPDGTANENMQSEESQKAEDEVNNIPGQTGDVDASAFNDLVDVVKTLVSEIQDIQEVVEEVQELRKQNESMNKQIEKFRAELNLSNDVPATQKDKKNFGKKDTNEMAERFFKGWQQEEK